MAGDNLIQSGSIQRRLADAFNMKERSPAPTLAPEIQAVVLVEDLTRPDRSDTMKVCSFGMQRVGVAGNVSQVALINPAASGILATVDQLLLNHEDGAAGHTFQILTIPETSWAVVASTGGQVINTRNPIVDRSSCLVDAATRAVPAVGISIAFLFLPTFCPTMDYAPVGMVVPPGNVMVVQCLQNATTVDCGFVWREEALPR